MLYIFITYFWEDLQNTASNVSIYYRIISLLNSKINLVILIIVLLVVYMNVQKNSKGLKNYMYIMFIYINMLLCNIQRGYNFMESDFITLNLNLLNGLMLIHPAILYTFYVFHILVFKVNLLNSLGKLNKITISFNKNIDICTNVLLSIILGCW
jgi:hypothetical protein